MTLHQHEEWIESLEATGNYKILRRLVLGPRRFIWPAGPLKRALLIDVETTGLDPIGRSDVPDEIIEFAALPITYTPWGDVAEILPGLSCLREPTKPISPHITKLTGITPEMVRGHTIKLSELTELVCDADLVIAHNAGFDRPFVERLCADFIRVPWACSQTQIPWIEHGYSGMKLAYLLGAYGLFHEGHRGLADCFALAEILRRPLGTSGLPALCYLLESLAQPMTRVFAAGAPYDKKECLRQRAYRWSAGERGAPRSWYRDCRGDEVAAEVEWLQSLILPAGRQPLLVRLDARDQFSERA